MFSLYLWRSKGEVFICAAVEGEESQAAAPGLSLCATHGIGLVCQLCAWECQDSCRRDAALTQMDSPKSRPGGGPVSGALSPPGLGQAAAQKWSRRA